MGQLWTINSQPAVMGHSRFFHVQEVKKTRWESALGSAWFGFHLNK